MVNTKEWLFEEQEETIKELRAQLLRKDRALKAAMLEIEELREQIKGYYEQLKESAIRLV